MARASSGLAYPERFYAAAAYAGFGGSSNSSVISKFQNDVALLLYGLYQQATAGPCDVPKPRVWNPVEHSKWTSWNGLGNMATTEAMRLFVKILEEEDPAWYSRVPEVVEPVVEVQVTKPKLKPTMPNGNSSEPKAIMSEKEILLETRDKDVVLDGLGSVNIYDQWIPPSISGARPKARYSHGAAVIESKMYVFGGNHNGRYLSDLQVLDLRSLTWNKVDVIASNSVDSSSTPVLPCAGHSLISCGNKLLSVGGHTKDPSESIIVKEFDPASCTWSNLKSYGNSPASRGGQSVSLVGTNLVMFGGEDAKRTLLNDLQILDLETMTWDEIDTVGVPPSPRFDHIAAVHAERYLLIFGGGSHDACFNDLHVLDLQSLQMEWSMPVQQGEIPSPRAGHAGVTVGENWFIAGGGDNKSGITETVVLNMSTLVWSVVTSVEGRVPLASEGLSLVVSSHSGEDILVSFGGYNGRYSNEVYVLKPSHKSTIQTKMIKGAVPDDSVIPQLPTTNESRDVDSEMETVPEGQIREIAVDNVDPVSVEIVERNIKNEEISEQLISTLKAEKEELAAALTKEQMHTLQLKQEMTEAETRHTDLAKELQSVRSQLASEQSRCFKLEVDLAELRQKLQSMETLQKEVELLQRQKAASEQAALNARQRQSSGGLWSWMAGTPPES